MRPCPLGGRLRDRPAAATELSFLSSFGDISTWMWDRCTHMQQSPYLIHSVANRGPADNFALESRGVKAMRSFVHATRLSAFLLLASTASGAFSQEWNFHVTADGRSIGTHTFKVSGDTHSRSV